MRLAWLPLIATVILLSLGTLFFRSTPPKAQPVKAAGTAEHLEEKFWADSSSRTVFQAFAQAGVAYYPEDKVVAFPDPSLGLGSIITVSRAMPVVVQDGKKVHTLRTWEETVSGLLAEKKFELGAEDRIAPGHETPLSPNIRLTITRVARTQVTEKEVIAFQTTVEKDFSQFVGSQTVLQSGKNGEREKAFLLVREDGELVSKTLLKTTTTVAPQTARIQQGALNPISGKCAAYKDWVVDAATKNKIDPNALFYRMQKESNCNPTSQAAAGYQGMLQYDPSLWIKLSKDAGYSGSSIWDAKSQIYVTAWAWAHGQRSRWPNP